MPNPDYTPRKDLNAFLSQELKEVLDNEVRTGYEQPKDEVDPELGRIRVNGEYIGTDIDSTVKDEDIPRE